MASLVGIFIAVAIGCLSVEGIRIDPVRVTSSGKYFATSDLPDITRNDPRCTRNGLFANPTDCTKYYSCKDGHSQARVCPDGFKFDSYHHCTPDDDADCGNRDHLLKQIGYDVVCPEDFGQFPFPPDCHKYITCDLGKPKVWLCPDNQIYQNLVGCVDGNGCPQRADSVCKQPNGLYPAADCSKYIKCVNGEPKEKQCPQGQGFDRMRKVCTTLQNARCRSNEIHEVMEN